SLVSPHAPICSNSQPKTSSSASPNSSDSAASRARPSDPDHQAVRAASRSVIREVRTGTIQAGNSEKLPVKLIAPSTVASVPRHPCLGGAKLARRTSRQKSRLLPTGKKRHRRLFAIERG